MICSYCGNDNPENADVCGFCGAPLGVVNEPASGKNPLEPDYTVIEPASRPVDLPPEPERMYTQPEVLPYSPSQTPPLPARKTGGNRIWWLVGCVVIVLVFLCCIIGLLTVYGIAGRLRINPSLPVSTPATFNLQPNQSIAVQQDVLLVDDFSDTTSGWDSVDTVDYHSDYFENSYRITVNTSMSDSWANPGNNVFNDVQVEAEAKKNAGPDDNEFGLICRYKGANAFYYAVISSDGFYGILKVTSEATTQLGYSELQPNAAILTGAATNQVRFDCVGNTLTLYANGQLIDTQTDSTYTSGNVGLIAGTYDTPGTDILFDNFTVLKP